MNRPPAAFETAAEHVSFELTQLARMARYVADPTLPAEVRIGCFESMLLHARSLIDFTVRRRGKPSDLHRSDFVGEWTPSDSAARARLSDAVVVLNKHLAHLTWERVTDGQQAWKYEDIAADVLDVFGEFVAEAKARDAPAYQRLELGLTEARAASARTMTPLGAGTPAATTTSSGRVDVSDFSHFG